MIESGGVMNCLYDTGCLTKEIAIELPMYFDETYPDVLKREWSAQGCEQALIKAFKSKADYVCIKFNIASTIKNSKENLEQAVERELENIDCFIKKNLKNNPKPLILRGANNTDIDKILVPNLAKLAPKDSIIAFADEYTYEYIVPQCVEYGHRLVLRTPIDINLAKELNILSIDKGISPQKILIDPDMGGLGYGLDYGYSIIEKIKQAAIGYDSAHGVKSLNAEKMLDMPIIAFIGEESYRAKEAKSETFSVAWGDYQKRAAMWEIAGAAAMLSAGADIVVVWNPTSVKSLKGVVC